WITQKGLVRKIDFTDPGRVGEGHHDGAASPLIKPDVQISRIRLPRKQSVTKHAQEVTLDVKGTASRGVAVGRRTSPLPEAGRGVGSDVADGASDGRGRTG